jgi:hypothetical protein
MQRDTFLSKKTVKIPQHIPFWANSPLVSLLSFCLWVLRPLISFYARHARLAMWQIEGLLCLSQGICQPHWTTSQRRHDMYQYLPYLHQIQGCEWSIKMHTAAYPQAIESFDDSITCCEQLGVRVAQCVTEGLLNACSGKWLRVTPEWPNYLFPIRMSVKQTMHGK